MKKILIAALAASTALTGFAGAGVASAQPYYAQERYRDSDRDGRPDAQEWNRDRDRDGRPDQYDRNDNRRGGNQYRHYDNRRGYDGYRGHWREGARYSHYRDRAYYIQDYRAYNLPAPRQGYRYYRDDSGDILMVAIASGVIGAILGGALSDNDHNNYRGNYNYRR